MPANAVEEWKGKPAREVHMDHYRQRYSSGVPATRSGDRFSSSADTSS